MAKKTTPEKTSLSAAPKPKKSPAKRKPAAKAATAAKAVPAPQAAPAPKKVVATKPKTGKAKPAISISADDIALRAYFIAERRQNLGWEGSSEGDWLEAKRQLEEEAANPGL